MMDVKRKLRTKCMPIILKNFWYVNEGDKQLKEIFNSADFVRFSQIEKVLMDKNLPEGHIAEFGVYKGRLTKLLAKVAAIKKCKLYLFDTFEGFNSGDLCEEKRKGFNTKFEYFADTDEIAVFDICKKSGMNETDVRIKKGYFPDSLDEETKQQKFSFISIDFDLYKPIKDALFLMYDNVVPGGYIFVHDYGNKKYEGAKAAVNEFIEEKKIKNYIELCDYCGTMIIKKE